VNNIPEFPNLNSNNHKDTSGATENYNCIAWALEKNDVWCWPDQYGYSCWPIKNRKATPDAFIEMFAAFGYERCEDCALEEGWQKIVIYIKDGKPTHAARQLKNGKWTSKLGGYIDIEHDSLEVMNGPGYGTATIIMKRNNNS
jgi:hypothetical protein